MDIKQIATEAQTYRRHIERVKKDLAPSDFSWYPYGTLDNFVHLQNLLTGDSRNLLALAGDLPVADIGAADGDTAFFLETLGHKSDVIDFPPTNFNSCRGLRLLKEALKSGVSLHEVDLDAHFELPGQRYGLAFFMGILYHLKNPFSALENLSRIAHHALVSTRITRYNCATASKGGEINAHRVELRTVPAAYLVDSYETNGDPTNYWIFSDAGLRRILDRTGWDVVDFMTVGNTSQSDPASAAGDERAFCLIRSRTFV
ncbi:MAG: hypothetical protein ABIR62_14195 [Dokdonella sp.]|uniref:class I SAM-dependent methyltransferase n=1 Tax=Dokdonella sp. TaxID=2291710 RepID=UPI0032644887